MNDETSDFEFLNEEIDRRLVPSLKTHAMVLGENNEHLFAAGVADMDFKAPQCVLDALQTRLNHGIFGYEAMADELLDALLNWQFEHHGWQIERETLLRSPNVLNTLAIATSLFSNLGDAIIVQPPVFFDFFDVIRENGREVLTNPLILRDGRYVMDFDDLEEKTASPEAKIIYLCNPHNPVGRVWTKQELTKLGEICARNEVLVVSDEMHGDLTFRGHSYTPFASLGENFARNSITCISPAKTFNIASCCSAFAIVPDETRRKAFQVENSRLTVNKNNAFANAAMQSAYRGGAPWLANVLQYLEGNLALVQKHLEDIPGVELIEPEATFLLWLDFRSLGFTPEELHDFLRNKANWAVTRGISFGKEGAGFARLNIGCTRLKLEKALGELGSAISRHET